MCILILSRPKHPTFVGHIASHNTPTPATAEARGAYVLHSDWPNVNYIANIHHIVHTEKSSTVYGENVPIFSNIIHIWRICPVFSTQSC